MIYTLLMKNNTILIVDVKLQHLVPISTVVATITTNFWVLIKILMYICILKQGKNLLQNNLASSYSKAVFSPKTLEPWLGPLGRGQSGVLWFPLSLICS